MQCEHCQYDLTGLPVRGKCPECGTPYNLIRQAVAEKSPTLRYERGERVKAKLRTFILAGLTLLILAIGGIAAMGSSQPFRPLLIAMIFAVVTAMATVLSFLAERQNPSG